VGWVGGNEEEKVKEKGKEKEKEKEKENEKENEKEKEEMMTRATVDDLFRFCKFRVIADL
jgi:hypothetical protein